MSARYRVFHSATFGQGARLGFKVLFVSTLRKIIIWVIHSIDVRGYEILYLVIYLFKILGLYFY
jgi:hypothetical protein